MRPTEADAPGIGAADEVFHPATSDPLWNETGWFGFAVLPERDLNRFVYYFHDARTGVSGGGPALWDRAASRPTTACSTTGAGRSRPPALWISPTSGYRTRCGTKC